MNLDLNAFRQLGGRNIAVVGASGYIGSQIVRALAALDARILCVSRSKIQFETPYEWITGSVSDYQIWHQVIDRADVILHLAGNTSLYDAERDPYTSLKDTTLPITHLINAARVLGKTPKVIYASTATVYGLMEEFPVPETAATDPITSYDLYKYFAEMTLMLATRNKELNATILRLSNVYGPSQHSCRSPDRGVLNKVAAMALESKEIFLYGNGEYIRDYVYIDDVVRAFLSAAVVSDSIGGVFNIGSGVGTSVKQVFESVAQIARQISGHKVGIVQVPWPENILQIEKRNYVADTSRFRAATSWMPEIDMQSGLRLLLESHQHKITP